MCERQSAEGLNSYFGRPPDRVACDLVGLPKWTVRHHLLAEMEGLIVELRPMTPEDWSKAAQDYHENLLAVSFVSPPAMWRLVVSELRPTGLRVQGAAIEGRSS